MAVQVNKLQTISGHKDCVYTLQGVPESSRFFSASGDGMIVSWDLSNPENGELIARLPHSVYALHYYPPTGLLIAGHNYEGIHLLDWKNKTEVGSLQLTKAAVFDIKSFDETLVVASGDGMVATVDPASL